MANKRDDIVVNLRANATDLINNLEKVKNELEKTTNLKKTESLEKGFDSLNLQVKKLIETLKQPMDSKNLTTALKQLQKIQEQANKFSKSMSFLSKDSKATVFDVDSIRNFDEVIIRSQQDINRMSQELKTVRDEIKKTAKELNSIDRNKILDQTLNKKNIKTSDYKTAKNEARQANIVEASQRLAENESVKSQISGIEAANKKVEANIKISEKKIADWQVEIQELENQIATLKNKADTSNDPKIKKSQQIVKDFSEAERSEYYGSTKKEYLSGLRNNLITDENQIKKMQEQISILDKSSDTYKNFVKWIESRKLKLEKEKKELELLEQEEKEYLKAQQYLLENVGPSDEELAQIKTLKKSAASKKGAITKKEKYIDSQRKILGINTEQIKQLKTQLVPGTKTDLNKVKSFFEKLNISISDVEASDPELVFDKIKNLFNEIETEVNQAEKKIKNNLEDTLLDAQIQEEELTQNISKAQTNIDAKKSEKAIYMGGVIKDRIISTEEGLKPIPENMQNLEDQEVVLKNLIDDEKKREQLEAETAKTIKEQNKQYKNAESSVTRVVNRLNDAFNRGVSNFGGFYALRSIVLDIENTLKELDDSFLSIAAVSDYSMSDMWNKYSDYSKLANKVGQSTKDTIETSALWIQQGKEFDEAMELTEHTIKLATISGQNFATVTQQMTSALQSFNLEASDAGTVTDVFSELAAKAAADVDGIANAVAKVGSLAYTSGIDLQTTSAMLTEMIESTQEAPETIGTSMRTILGRLTQIKTGVSDLSEEELQDLDFNRVDTALKSIGVSLKDTNGQIRDADDVLFDVAKKWENLDSNTQHYLATQMAGTQQQSRFIALMNGYNRTVELQSIAYNSAGKASENFSKVQDTLSYSINQTKNNMEQLKTSILSSKSLKGVIDMFNNFLSGVTEVGGSQTIASLISEIMSVKSILTQVRNFSLKQGSTELANAGQTVYQWIHKGATELAMASSGSSVTSGGIGSVAKGTKSGVKGKASSLLKSSSFRSLGFSLLGNAASGIANANALGKGNRQATAITAMGSIAGSAISIIPGWGQIAGGVIQLATAGIGIVVGHFEEQSRELKKREQQLKQANEKIDDYISTTTQDLADSVSKVKSSRSSYTTFKSKSERYQELAGQGFLTSDEQSEMATLFSELKDNYADYVTVVDENNSLLELNSGALDKLKESTDEIIKQNQADIKRDATGLVASYNKQVETDQKISRKIAKEVTDTSIDEGTSKRYLYQYSADGGKFQSYVESLSKKTQETIYPLLEKEFPELESNFSNLNEILAKTPNKVEKLSEIISQVTNDLNNDKEIQNALDKSEAAYIQTLGSEHVSSAMAEAIAKGVDSTIGKKTKDYTEDEFTKNPAKYLNGDFNATRAVQTLVNKGVGLSAIKNMTASDLSEQLDNKEYYDALIAQLKAAVPDLEIDSATEKQMEEAWNQMITNANINISVEKSGELIEKITKGLESENEEVKEKATKADAILNQIENSGDLTVKQIGELWDKLYSMYSSAGVNVNAIKKEYTQETVKKEKELSNIFGSDKNIFADYTQAEINNLYTIFTSKLGTTSKTQQAEMAKIIDESVDGISNKQRQGLLDIFSDIDLTKGYSTLEKQVNTWADALEEYGWDYQSACEVLENYILKGTSNLIKGFKNVSDLKVSIENSVSAVDSIVSDSKDINDIVQAYNKGETITSDNLGNLLKAGMGSAYTSSGKIDTKALQTSFINRISQQYASLFGQSLGTQQNLDVFKKYQKTNMNATTLSQIQSALASDNPQEAIAKMKSSQSRELASALLNSGVDTSNLSTSTYKNIIQTAVKSASDTVAEWNSEQPALKDYYSKAMMEALTGYSSKDDIQNAIDDLKKSIDDAEKSVKDAKKSLDNAQKAYDEALYGSKYRDNPLGDSYEYDLKIQRSSDKVSEFSTKIGNATDSLGNFIDKAEALNNWAEYISAQQESVDLYSAKSQVLDIRKNDIQNVLQDRIGNLLSYDEQGHMWLDDYALTQLKTNDAWVNEYADLYKEYQEIIDTQKEYSNKIDEVNQSIIELKKTALNNYLSAAQSVGDIFKQQDDKQIEQTKEKYSALKEADDDYLSALEESINKQKSLRDTQNKYENLATQEKKLSLLQRDTSGANRVSTAQLEKDVQDSRQDLLDDEISNALDNLKEWYSKQQEQWDKETELLSEISDNTNYTKIGQDWLSSAQLNPEEAIAQLQEMTDGYEQMTTEQIQQLYNTYAEYISQANNYSASLNAETVSANAENIASIINTTGETLTTSVATKMAQVDQTVNDAIKDATDALVDANEAYKEAQQAYAETLDKNKIEIESLEQILGTWDTTMKNATTTVSKMIEELNKASSIPKYEGEDSTSKYQRTWNGKALTEEQEHNMAASKGKALATQRIEQNTNEVKKSLKKAKAIDKLSAKEQMNYLYSWSDGKNRYYFKTEDELKRTIDSARRLGLVSSKQGNMWKKSEGNTTNHKFYQKYATGGLVDYTGPAWVDGTKSKPEAFLSSEDTYRIGKAAQVLSNIPAFNPSNESSVDSLNSQSFGDTSIEININVDSISSDYDVDQMIDRMKNEITTAANYKGSNVILKK